MRKLILPLTIIGMFAFSCNNASEEEQKTTTTPVENNADQSNALIPMNNTAQQQPTPAPANNVVGNKGEEGDVKLNPPHGEPGHRCDIEVGMPLNSAPKAAPSVQMNNAPQAIQQQPSAAKVPANPAMSGKPNPAHGQPGHRCDMQVGDILP